MLVVNNSVLFFFLGNRFEFFDVKILIVFISYKDFRDMNQILGDNIIVKMYFLLWFNFDYIMVVIFVIVVFIVVLGGYWSGLVELENLKVVIIEDREMRKKKEEYLIFSFFIVVIFVVICCVMMVLFYFFYKWLVYVMIVIFCIVLVMSLYNCFVVLIYKILYG